MWHLGSVSISFQQVTQQFSSAFNQPKDFMNTLKTCLNAEQQVTCESHVISLFNWLSGPLPSRSITLLGCPWHLWSHEVLPTTAKALESSHDVKSRVGGSKPGLQGKEQATEVAGKHTIDATSKAQVSLMGFFSHTVTDRCLRWLGVELIRFQISSSVSSLVVEWNHTEAKAPAARKGTSIHISYL